MKKILFAIFLFSASTLKAQTDKGNLMAGGQLTLNTNKDGSDFRFNPQFGVFVANNFAVGAELTFDYSKAGVISSNEFGIGPFARYYFGKSQTKPFLVTSVDYLVQSSRINNLKTSATGWALLAGAGFAAFITRNVAVEAIAGYRYADYSNTDGSGGLNLSLGFQLYFGRDLGQDIRKTVTGN